MFARPGLRFFCFFLLALSDWSWAATQDRIHLRFYKRNDAERSYQERSGNLCVKFVKEMSDDEKVFKSLFRGQFNHPTAEQSAAMIEWIRVNLGVGPQRFLQNFIQLPAGSMQGEWVARLDRDRLLMLEGYARDLVPFLASGLSVPKHLAIRRLQADLEVELGHFRALAGNAALAQVETLEFLPWNFHTQWAFGAAGELISSAHLTGVKSFAMSQWAWSSHLLNALNTAVFRNSLESLTLRSVELTSHALDLLQSAGAFAKVTKLDISFNGGTVDFDTLLKFVEANFPVLTELDITGHICSATHAEALLRSPLMTQPRLTKLIVRGVAGRIHSEPVRSALLQHPRVQVEVQGRDF